MTPGPACIALIQQFEGCAKKQANGSFMAYPDPGTGGDPWTIGWGATGPGIAPGTVWTQQQCDARLEQDLVRYAEEVDRALGGAETSQAQFDALVSFHYNTGAIARATLTRKHGAGNFKGAAADFGPWGAVLAAAGIPVVFNTGRSADFIREQVMEEAHDTARQIVEPVDQYQAAPLLERLERSLREDSASSRREHGEAARTMT